MSERSEVANYNHPEIIDVSKPCAVISPYEIRESYKRVPQGATKTCDPGGTNLWYVSGLEGASVDISLDRLPNTGGHHHSGGPVGSVSPSSITLYGPNPQNVKVTFTAPSAAGMIRQRGVFSDGTIDTDFNNVALIGLTPLLGSTYITLQGSTTEHPGNHYGTATLVNGIKALARAFYGRFDKPLHVNDMSLPTGGLFDINDNWTTPHITHQTGHNVDMNRSEMSSTERTYFESTARSLGFTVAVHPSGPGKPDHWHLTK